MKDSGPNNLQHFPCGKVVADWININIVIAFLTTVINVSY